MAKTKNIARNIWTNLNSIITLDWMFWKSKNGRTLHSPRVRYSVWTTKRLIANHSTIGKTQ